MSARSPVELRTLWRLARPGGMPLVLALPLVGFGFGHWEWGLSLRDPERLVAVLIGWWFLSAGTLWLNAALDRDEGEVLMGPHTSVPEGLEPWAYGALVLAVGFAALGGWVAGAAAAAAAALAVLYSHPRTAWKGHPVGGPLVNLVGYGLLSPLAGWSLVHTSPTLRTLPTLLLIVGWIAATYFGAQAFQQQEDAARGYRTLVVTHGPHAVLLLVRWLYGLTFWLAMGLTAIGMYPRLALAAIPSWVALDRHLAAWRRQPDGGDAWWARRMLRAAATLTGVLLLTVAIQHLWHVVGGGAPAGLGTAWRPAPIQGPEPW